jgi:hypothetical protein
MRAVVTVVDVALSRKVADAMRPKAGDCFVNAFCAISTLVDVLGLPNSSTLRYVEGVAGGNDGRTAAHAWVETEDGRIVEVTPGWLNAAETLAHLGEASERHYSARRRFTVLEVCAHLHRRGATLPVVGDLAGTLNEG